jgi:hypothetical protein
METPMSVTRAVVGDARQRDVGKGVARISQRLMTELGVKAGDVIEIVGKKRTVAIAWPGYTEDQAQDLIRIDGFLRKNAQVVIKEAVLVIKAEVQDAKRVVLAPIDMRINVDEDFTKFVKNRLMERAFVEGDATLIMLLGHVVPFDVFRTQPSGVPIRVGPATTFQILSEPLTSEHKVSTHLDIKYFFRIPWLNNLMSQMKAGRVVFSIKDSEVSDVDEDRVTNAAKVLAESTYSTAHIEVRFESDGKVIGELPWADVDPLGRVSSAYPDVLLPPAMPSIVRDGDYEKATPPMKRCFKTGVAHCPKDIKFSLRSVVVAMPFGDDFKDTYTHAIRPALEESGFRPWKADEQISNIDIMCKVCQAIQESGYVLANITTWNANVVFELGLAYGLGRSAILIKHKKAEVPVDLKGIEYIEYGTIDDLKRNLLLFLKQATNQR